MGVGRHTRSPVASWVRIREAPDRIKETVTMSRQVGPPGTNYIRIELDFWYNASDRSIHIASRDGTSLISTVNDEAGSKRQHSNLFRKLKSLLVENDRWPSET